MHFFLLICAVLYKSFCETVLLLNISEAIGGYRGWLPIESVSSLGRMLVFVIDNWYCNRFIHIGRPIFSVNRSGPLFTIRQHLGMRMRSETPLTQSATQVGSSLLNSSMLWLFRETIYVSNNCIYIQSHLLRWYKLNCKQFNYCERPLLFFSQHRSTATIHHFFLLSSGDCTMT